MLCHSLRHSGNQGRQPGLALAMVLVAAAMGCDRDIDTTYAAVRGPSINGVAAFVQLLRDTGHDVTARQYLPSEIDPEIVTIVVFDDSFTALDSTAAELLTEFLQTGGPRTLLLVLRDSDGAIDYLRDVLSHDELTADRHDRAERMLCRLEQAVAEVTTVPRPATSPFPDGLAPHRRSPTAEPIEVRIRPQMAEPERLITARWELRRRLEPDTTAPTIWTAGEDRLLVRRRMNEATILVLASAAPLVNGGLVDPGNRGLAADLAGRLPTTGRLLVAGSGQVAGGGGGDGDEEPSPWRLLGIQPLPWVAAQAIAALALFCWCTAPIFGRPRRSSPTHAQDFGHHVEALANLFDKSPAAGTAFAREQLAAWQPTATVAPRKRPDPSRR